MMRHRGRTRRSAWPTATFVAVLVLAVAGCGGSSTTAAHRLPTATLVPPSTATTAPTAAPTPVGMPCGQIIDAYHPVVARIGDLQVTMPNPLAIDPPRQLPDNPLAQDSLLFVSTGLEDGRVFLGGDKAPEQGGLTEARVAFDHDDLGQASRRGVEGRSELLELGCSAEKAADLAGRQGANLRIHR